MTTATIITGISIYLIIGFLLSAAFQDNQRLSLSAALFYPIVLAFLCILTIILFIFDDVSDAKSEYMA